MDAITGLLSAMASAALSPNVSYHSEGTIIKDDSEIVFSRSFPDLKPRSSTLCGISFSTRSPFPAIFIWISGSRLAVRINDFIPFSSDKLSRVPPVVPEGLPVASTPPEYH